MSDTWVKETLELINDLEKSRQSLQGEFDRLQNELSDLDQHIIAGHNLVAAYIKKHNINPIINENVKLGNSEKSYPVMLVDIAKQNDGILNVSGAVELLYKASVGKDRNAIQHNVYNALSRMQPQFLKISRGQYRLTSSEPSTSNRKRRVTSGIRNAVLEIKKQHPEMTSKEIVEALTNNGFDFKGKRPIQAVNLALAYLVKYKKQIPEMRVGIPAVQGIKEVVPQLPGLSEVK